MRSHVEGWARSARGRMVLIALLAFAVRSVYVLTYSRNAPLGFDANRYYELGRRIADHFSYDDATIGKPSALFPPGYPALLALGRVVGLGTRTKLLMLAVCVGTATVVMIAKLAREHAGESVGTVAGVLAAVYPNLFLADGALMTESLAALLVVALLWLALRWQQQPTIRYALGIGLASSWYCLTRSDGFVFVGLLIIACWLSGRHSAQSELPTRSVAPERATALRGIAVMALIPIVMVAAWQVRVQQQMDAFVPIAVNGWAVVAGANCDATFHGDRVGSWELPCVKVVEAAERGHIGEVAANRYARDVGMQYVRGHIGDLPRVALARVARTFGVYQPWRELEIESYFEGRHETWSKVGYLMYLALAGLAAYGYSVRRRAGIRSRRANHGSELFAVPWIAAMLSTVVAYGNHRFRISVEPLIVIGASMTIVALARRHSVREGSAT